MPRRWKPSDREARVFWPFLVLLCTTAGSALAQGTGEFTGRFEIAWNLINERYWNLDVIPVDWDEVHARYGTRVEKLTDEAGYWQLMESMYQEIADDHSVFVPPDRVEEIRELYGNMACVAVLGQADLAGSHGTISWELLELDGARAGLITIPDLASDFVPSNVRAAVQDLTAQGVDGLFVDLRGNPGGRLLSMMQVAGIFSSGFLWRLVTTWSLPLPYPAIGPVETDLPLALLIDGNVHSAAEGLAGALRQNGRATTIGSHTAGNVEAILPFCLRDGSQAWVAAGVLAPLGAPTWQNVGVEADIEVDSSQAVDAAADWLLGLLAD